MGGNRPGSGPGGNCVCPKCGAKLTHPQGVPCYNLSCPKCGAKMVKE
jgi:DNA-directed RNA polymerase subunit RPC12/RpoP